MISFDDVIKEKMKVYNPKLAANFWSAIHNTINWRLRSGKRVVYLFNLINYQPYIYKIHLYTKDSYEAN